MASPLTSSPLTSCLYRLITWVRLSLACRISAGIGMEGRGQAGEVVGPLEKQEEPPTPPPQRVCEGEESCNPLRLWGPESRAGVETCRWKCTQNMEGTVRQGGE